MGDRGGEGLGELRRRETVLQLLGHAVHSMITAFSGNKSSKCYLSNIYITCDHQYNLWLTQSMTTLSNEFHGNRMFLWSKC